MPLTEEEIKNLIDLRITQRFNNIGIWDETKDQLEATRANNKQINEIRLFRENRQNFLGRSFMDIITSIGGNLLWVILTGAVVWALQFIQVSHKQ